MEGNERSPISVADIAECLGGEVLTCREALGETVACFMIGAMCVDPAPTYFGQRSDKAVITRGDRADIQLGALVTPTKCLILTGGTKPIPMVMDQARQAGVPIILVGEATLATVERLEGRFGRSAPAGQGGEGEAEQPSE